ncbi:MAG: hypothetical protein NT002_13735 [candidate division Zixibacteria bacterium]|nr:hypothetical protein [candidate division Zixibacteria bacterium]
MRIIVILIGFLSRMTGIILLLWSLWYRVPDHPGITGVGTGRLLKFWKCRDLYTGPDSNCSSGAIYFSAPEY